MQEQQLIVNLDNLDNLIKERNSLMDEPWSTQDWGNFKIKGKIDLYMGKQNVFEKGLKGVQEASMPMVQKYGMDIQSELGEVISDLNKYFKAERKRITKDYDNVLYQLNIELKQNQQYIPSEFKKVVSKLFSDFSDNKQVVEPVNFVPYKKQIPAYKFDMVVYLCLASVIYGLYEYALDEEKTLLRKVEHEYKKGLPVIKKVTEEFQSLLLPALKQLNNPENTKETQDYVEEISNLRKKLCKWDYRVTMGEATKQDGYFANGIRDISYADSAYDRLVSIANWMYTWRYGRLGKVSGKYVMYPVLELFGNALASDVQAKADDIANYRRIADYVNHRLNFVKQVNTK